MRRSATVLLLGLTFSCRSSQPAPGPIVTFVHATDPHLFEDTTETRDTSADGRRRATARRQWQGTLDAQALAALMQEMKGLAGGAEAPSFLVITGDFGVDYTWGVADNLGTAAERQKRQEIRGQQADTTAALLRTSPVRDIYLVPGNNDIAGESADTLAAAASARFFDSVQTRLRRSGAGVVLHNLAGCYVSDNAPASGCAADVSGTDLRLLGFASYSFKNADSAYRADVKVRDTTNARQERQIARLETMVAQAADAGKRVLVLSHIPSLDDPYYKARGLFAADTGKGFGTPQRQWSTWNVSPKVLEGWKRAVESPAVLAVLAGHFHDSHREIYVPPYTWSASSTLLPPPEKLLVAPPLAVRLQDASPIQARGFALIRVGGDSVKRRLYWYNGESRTFRAEASTLLPAPASPPSSLSWVATVWGLGGGITDLNKAALLAVAFVAAFLTVIYIWKIGEFRSELISAASAAKDRAGASAGPEPSKVEATSDGDSPFTNRIGKAVLAGFGGLAVITVLSDLAGDKEAKAFYVVLFVLLFVVLLLVAAVSHALVEALRSRIVVEQPLSPGADWGKRLLAWIGSLRTSTLVFFDNAVNVVLGRNRLESTALADEIYRLQWSLVGVAKRLRLELFGAVQRALAERCRNECFDENDFRVNISVYQSRLGTVKYVASSPRSLRKEFPKKTVAWVSTYYGIARWWKVDYKDPEIVLWEEGGEKLMLNEYFEPRERSDYEAFIVLPVPWGRRGIVENYQPGAIHISFRKREYMDRLFDNLDKSERKGDSLIPNYQEWEQMLDEAGPPCEGQAGTGQTQVAQSEQIQPSGVRDQTEPTKQELTRPPQLHKDLKELRVVLRTAIEVLGESLRFYNEAVFNNLRPPANVR
jgi:hypothetical protein